MKTLLLTLTLLSVVLFSASAQKAKPDSLLRNNSVGVEFTCVPHFISEARYGYPIFPEFEVQYERKIFPKMFVSLGVIYPYTYDDYFYSNVYEFELPNDRNKGNMEVRAGLDYKLRLAHHIYFSPSVDIYWIKERYITYHNPKWEEYSVRQFMALGPDLQFEYRTKRVSVVSSLLAFSGGDSGLYNLRAHKALSLGVHYNF